MSRSVAAALIVGLAAIAVAVLLWWRLGVHPARQTASSTAPAGAAAGVPNGAAAPTPLATVPFELVFPGPGGRLYRERRDLAVPPEPRRRAEALVSALLAGPRGEGLVGPFPAGVTLTGVFLAADGTAYVDLAAASEARITAAGSRRELQTVYSLVETLTLNLPTVQSVVLLINGAQPLTLAGHLDLSRPLTRNDDLVATAP